MAAVDEIDNEAEVPVEEEMQELRGNWDKNDHKSFVSGKYADNYVENPKVYQIL